jgi:hypothetical protein
MVFVIIVQHMALTIDEELSLHNRLLTELDDDVTVTHSRMKVQTHRSFRRLWAACLGCPAICYVSLLGSAVHIWVYCSRCCRAACSADFSIHFAGSSEARAADLA